MVLRGAPFILTGFLTIVAISLGYSLNLIILERFTGLIWLAASVARGFEVCEDRKRHTRRLTLDAAGELCVRFRVQNTRVLLFRVFFFFFVVLFLPDTLCNAPV